MYQVWWPMARQDDGRLIWVKKWPESSLSLVLHKAPATPTQNYGWKDLWEICIFISSIPAEWEF